MGAAALGMHWGWPFPCQSQEQFLGPAWLGFTLQGWIQLRGSCFTPSAAALPLLRCPGLGMLTLLQHLQHSPNTCSVSSFGILLQQLQALLALPLSCPPRASSSSGVLLQGPRSVPSH